MSASGGPWRFPSAKAWYAAEREVQAGDSVATHGSESSVCWQAVMSKFMDENNSAKFSSEPTRESTKRGRHFCGTLHTCSSGCVRDTIWYCEVVGKVCGYTALCQTHHTHHHVANWAKRTA